MKWYSRRIFRLVVWQLPGKRLPLYTHLISLVWGVVTGHTTILVHMMLLGRMRNVLPKGLVSCLPCFVPTAAAASQHIDVTALNHCRGSLRRYVNSKSPVAGVEGG